MVLSIRLLTEFYQQNVSIVLTRSRCSFVYRPSKGCVFFVFFLTVSNIRLFKWETYTLRLWNANVTVCYWTSLKVAHPTSTLCEQAVQQTGFGPVTRSPPCWKATSAPATINTSLMGTSATPCLLSGWLSATVRQHRLILFPLRHRELDSLALIALNSAPSLADQLESNRTSLQWPTRKVLFGSTTQRAARTLCLKVRKQVLAIIIIIIIIFWCYWPFNIID